MTTPHERTKAVTDTRELLRTLASAHEITIGGLVQTVAPRLLRHYPLDIDLDVSAAALPEIWAAPKPGRAQQQPQTIKEAPSAGAVLTRAAIKEKMMTSRRPVPDDFPRDQAPGLLPDAQPKLLVREMDGRYHTCHRRRAVGTL